MVVRTICDGVSSEHDWVCHANGYPEEPCTCVEEEMTEKKTDAEIIADIVAGNTDPERALDRVKEELGVSGDILAFEYVSAGDSVDHLKLEGALNSAYDWEENPEHNVKIALAVYRPDLLLAPGIDDEYTDLTALKDRIDQEIALRTRAEKEKLELKARHDTLETLLCGLTYQVTKNKLQNKLDQGSFLDECRKVLLESKDATIRERSIDTEVAYEEARAKLAKALTPLELSVLKERGL